MFSRTKSLVSERQSVSFISSTTQPHAHATQHSTTPSSARGYFLNVLLDYWMLKLVSWWGRFSSQQEELV